MRRWRRRSRTEATAGSCQRSGGRRGGRGHRRPGHNPGRVRHRDRWRQHQPAQHRAGRRPVGVVQLLVHPVRPVLRSRPRPGRQGRQRHGLHSPAAGRSALRAGQPHQLHGADARHRVCRAPTASWARPTMSGRSTPRPRSSTRTRPTPRIPRTRCSCASTSSTPMASRSRPAS